MNVEQIVPEYVTTEKEVIQYVDEPYEVEKIVEVPKVMVCSL